MTDLIRAVEQGDNEEFESIVENPALDINERGEFGRTPLMVAAYGEWSEGNEVGPGFLEWLMLEPDIITDIKNDVEDDRVPGTGNTALHYAVSGPQEGRLNQVKMIMDHIQAESTILNMQNDNGDTVLMMVVDDGRNIDVVRYLCELPGIDLGIKNNDDRTALNIAIFRRETRGGLAGAMAQVILDAESRIAGSKKQSKKKKKKSKKKQSKKKKSKTKRNSKRKRKSKKYK